MARRGGAGILYWRWINGRLVETICLWGGRVRGQTSPMGFVLLLPYSFVLPLKQEDICKPGVRLTYFRVPFTYDTPCFCISGFFSSNILPPRSLSWLKAFSQSHLMSKTSCNNTTTMSQLRMKCLLSRQWYQVLSPLRIHCTPYSNCMCHSGNSAYQGLNGILWNFNIVIIKQHDGNKHKNNGPMAQLKSNLYL